jgi:outer membrane protein assembly factor BamB
MTVRSHWLFHVAVLLATSAAFSIASSVTAQEPLPQRNWPQSNWPQWRGPLGTGEAPQGSPPIKWSETENIKWKVKLPGSGTSTPIVWGDKIFIQTAIATGKKVEPAAQKEAAAGKENADAKKNDQKAGDARGGGPGGRGPGGFGRGGGRRGGGFGRGAPPTEIHRFVLLCIDRASGNTLWQKTASEVLPHEGHHQDHGFASHSPSTDGQHVIAYFGSRGLHCYDMEGNLKWSKDLGRMQTSNGFGEGSSPALFGNTIVVNWDHEGEDFIAAFDKRTGDELWREPRDERTTWSTPLVVEHDGQTQVIVGATSSIRSYDLKTGKQLWEAGGLTANVIPSPVAKGDMVYLTSGFRGSSLKAIRLGAGGNIEDSDAIVWRLGKGTPYVPSPLLYKDRIYIVSSNNNILSCYNALSGEPIAEMQRLDGISGIYASPVAADGRVYVVGRNGTTAVLKHAVQPTEEFEILSTNELADPIDASPAIAGNEIYLRGHEHLYCIAEK